MDKNVVLFTLTANPTLAAKVAKQLGTEISALEIKNFADGEVMVRPLVPVRGKTVYIINSTSTPVAERIMELLVFINALRNAKAKEVILVSPYYGFCRQDRIARAGEPLSAKLVADLYTNAGVDHFITMDLHTPQIEGFFDCTVDDLSPTPLFGKYFRDFLKKQKINYKDVTVVSPDHGSLHRARDLASEIPHASLGIIDKRRPEPNKAEVVNVIGNIKDQVCIIIDDIIDTGGTIVASAQALYSMGAKDVIVAATHGVLSDNAVDKLKEAGVSHICITDSIEKGVQGVDVISISEMIAGLIKATEEGKEVPDSWMNFY